MEVQGGMGQADYCAGVPMTIDEQARALVTLGKDGDYHCIFIGGLPMYHGMDVVMVTMQYEKAVDIVAVALLGERRGVWERAAQLGQETIDAYPTDVFIEPPQGQHGQTIDACSARAGRHLGKVFRDQCREQQAKEAG
jgi:hypothetical protein